MCIRDSADGVIASADVDLDGRAELLLTTSVFRPETSQLQTCLLYTSDAADERSSVDLGGRRIIKKKKKSTSTRESSTHQTKKTTLSE